MALSKDSPKRDMSRREFIRTTGFTVAAGSSLSWWLAACSSGGVASPLSSPSPSTAVATATAAASLAPAPATIKTALSWLPNNQFAGIWLGLENRYFEELGITVDWRPGGPNTPAGVERVSSGEVDLGQMSNQRPVLEAIAKGNDFLILGSRYQRQPGGLLSLAAKPVLEPKDIVGKTILGQSPTDARTIETVLALSNLPTDDFTFIPAGSDPQALIEGQGDALFAFVTNQPIALEKRGLVKDKDFFHRTWDELGMPGYNNLLFAKRAYVDENRDALVRYLKGEIRGWTENENDPSVAARLAVEKYGVDFGLDVEQETRANELQIPFFHSPDTDANGLFWIDRDRLAGPVYDALRAGGVTDLPKVDDVLDLSLLEEVHGS